MISKDLFNDDFNGSFTNVDFESYDELRFNPSHVRIDPEVMVDLVRDGQILRTASWEDIIQWINDNYRKLNGKFDVSRGGAVLHTITLSHHTS